MAVRRSHLRWYLVVVCIVVVFFLWRTSFSDPAKGQLTVAFLDVGQGDAIFIESPSGVQVLIDGGKDRKVLSELNSVMPFYDRDIDLVIGTHPDADHEGGLVNVLENYDVSIFIDPGLDKDVNFYKQIQNLIDEKNVAFVRTESGQIISLGDGAYLRIFFPYREFASTESNDYSVVAQLVYGETEVLLTGDSTILVESQLVDVFDGELESDILKVGHHGSKTSTSERFLETVDPEYGIISAGCDNSYGHPNDIVVERLQENDVEILETCRSGTIIFYSDGKGVQLE